MAFKKTFFSCCDGTSLVLMAVMFPVMLAAMGATVDMARLLAVQTKAQSASDAALLGAVSTMSTNSALYTEFVNQFKANFPTQYMGSNNTYGSTVSNGQGVYTSTLQFTVPTIILGYFNNNSTTITITSQVTNTYSNSSSQSLELTFVMDSSNDMTQAQVEEMKADALALASAFAPGGSFPSNVHVNVVPFDIMVNVTSNNYVGDPFNGSYGIDHWLQTSQPSCTIQPECSQISWMSTFNKFGHIEMINYTSPLTQRGIYDTGNNDYLSNRNSDYHAGFYNDTFNDVDDSPPTSEATAFRMPNANVAYNANYSGPAFWAPAAFPFTSSYAFYGGPTGTIYEGDNTACYPWDTMAPGDAPNPGMMSPTTITTPIPGLPSFTVTNSGVLTANPTGQSTYNFTVTMPQPLPLSTGAPYYSSFEMYYTTANGSAKVGTDLIGNGGTVLYMNQGQQTVQIPFTIQPANHNWAPGTIINFNIAINWACFQNNCVTFSAPVLVPAYIQEPKPHRDCINNMPPPSKILFGGNDLASINTPLASATMSSQYYQDNIQATQNYTRVNVGLMWGWFTLSSKWQGYWNAPSLPASPTSSNQVSKVMVLMGNNVNSVYTGGTYKGITMSNDDVTTKALCDAIKQSPDNITIYTVSPTGSSSNPLMSYCAGPPGTQGGTASANYYINASSPAATQTAVLGIANSVLWETLRLSQ